MEKIMIKKGAWSPQEDQKLKDYVMRFGIWNWSLMPKFAGLSRTGKSCRLRWMNYLHPDVKRGPFTTEERETVIKMYQELGNRWAAIAARLPGRTDNEVKNFFHTHLKKHLGLKTGPGKLSKATRRKEKNKTKLAHEEKPVNICDISPAASSSNIITFDQNEKMDIHGDQPNPIIDIANTVILESNPAAITHHDYSHTLSIHSLDQFVDTTSFWLNLLNDADRLVD